MRRLKNLSGVLFVALMTQVQTQAFGQQAPSTAPSPQNPAMVGTATASPTPAPLSLIPGPNANDLESKKPVNLLAEIIEDYNYKADGKRDPFLASERPRGTESMIGPLWPLQRFDLTELHLVGIIWNVKQPRAMITDPSGKSYVVAVNERIGRNNGYIARIREGEVVIVESFTTEGKLNYETKLLKLTTQ